MTNRQRCERCERPQALCYCSQIQTIDNLWPVHILQHPLESRHALGTARIAHLGLSRCTLTKSEHFSAVAPANFALIYPGDDSLPLSTLQDQSPRPLLFLDATWRKSRRMLFESPILAALPRYALESPPPSRYLIRREPTANTLSTLEAIVYTLTRLEHDHDKYLPLLQIMDGLIERHIDFMGQDIFVKNYGAKNHTGNQSGA